jgi:glycosyltransferase involved in cell wall biosynthesis
MKTKTIYRILMFARSFPPHRNSEAIVTGKLALAFLNKSINLHVIASKPIDLSFCDDQAIWSPLKAMTHYYSDIRLPGFQQFTKRLQGILLTGHPIKGISWVEYAVHEGLDMVKKNKYDLILSRSQPAEGHLPAMVISQKYHIPWIANWNDIEPGCMAPAPYGRGLSAKPKKITMRYLKTVIKKAHHHTFPSERLRRHMCKIYTNLEIKSSVIPHIAISGLQKETSHNNKLFTICHAGTFDGFRDPNPFFLAFSNFIKRNNIHDARMILLGNSQCGNLNYTVPSHLDQYIEIRPWVNYTTVLLTMATASVLLIIEAAAEEGIHLSGKFVDYVQSGRPILAVTPKNGTLNDAIQLAGGGIAVTNESPEDIEEAIHKLYLSWRKKSLSIDFKISKLQELFSEETIIKKYTHLFDRVLQKEE